MKQFHLIAQQETQNKPTVKGLYAGPAKIRNNDNVQW